jgi:hypothetical protein
VSRKKRFLKTLCLVAVLLVLVTLVQREIDRFRQAQSGTGFQIYQELDLASFAGTVLLAGFRGLAVDILWVRSLDLIERHQWFELSALYKLISKLQPNFPSVWVFNSWNLSHNISVHWDSKEDKWRWFKAGIDFAKEGLAKNPDSPELLFWLGSLYYQRIYRYVDLAHPEYKLYFLHQVEETEGQSAPEIALEYFIRARDIGRLPVFGPFALDTMVAHTTESVAWDALENKDIQKAVTYMEKAAAEWKLLIPKYPHLPIIRTHYQQAQLAAQWFSDETIPRILDLGAAAREALTFPDRDFDKAINCMEEIARAWKELSTKYPASQDLGDRHQRALELIRTLREEREKSAS